jgi:hypothetical protein
MQNSCYQKVLAAMSSALSSGWFGTGFGTQEIKGSLMFVMMWADRLWFCGPFNSAATGMTLRTPRMILMIVFTMHQSFGKFDLNFQAAQTTTCN